MTLARPLLHAARNFAPEALSPATAATQIEAAATSRLSMEAATSTTVGTLKAPLQLSLFPELKLPDISSKMAQQAIGTARATESEPLRKVFITLENPNTSLKFNREFVGAVNAREVLREGTMTEVKLVSFHHVPERGISKISPEVAGTLRKSDVIVTCHPEALAAQKTEEASLLLSRHLMPDASGTLGLRHSGIRVLEPESGRYGYLVDVVSQSFQDRFISAARGQLKLPFESSGLRTAPLGFQRRAQPWLFVDKPTESWRRSLFFS